jgi:hypothetical protein
VNTRFSFLTEAAEMIDPARPKPLAATNAKWINACILVGSGIFVFGLVVSAVFAPEWRLLHALQALIYVAVVVLTRRKSAYGFGAGVAVAVFWNSIGIFAATFFLDGVQDLWAAIRTGSAPRPDLLLQLLAFGGHLLIIVACLVGFFRTRPGIRRWGQFVAGGVLAIGYFAAIVFAAGPPSAVALFRRVFGL